MKKNIQQQKRYKTAYVNKVLICREGEDSVWKITYKKVKLPFHYIKEEVDYDAGAISIEAFGDIDGKKIFLYMTFGLTNSYMYDNGDYDEMIKKLENSQDKKVDLILKYKKNKLVGFELEQGTLANSMNDQRFDAIEFLYSSISNVSTKRQESNNMNNRHKADIMLYSKGYFPLVASFLILIFISVSIDDIWIYH